MVNNNQLHKNIRCITVSNCKHFCSAYVIENLSSELQQTKLFGIIIINVNMQVITEISGGNAISSKCVFISTKGCYCFSYRFNCYRELFPDCWLSYRKSMFVNIELRFKIKTFGNKWSKGHEISENCSRLTKHVICWVQRVRQNDFIATPFGVLRF